MAVKISAIQDTYQDSVKLMRVSSEISQSFGVDEAFAVMGTDENKALLTESDLVEESTLTAYDQNDLVLVVRDENPNTASDALAEIEQRIRGTQDSQDNEEESGQASSRSFYGALGRLPDANIVSISVPGQYATREAWKALQEGLHVHIFSDNLSIEDEHKLKSYGDDNDRLVMGPDCGSAIINGSPLGFANNVDEGAIGVVAAAGTGLQEVTSLIDRAGAGVSQAIGTGGRDLKDEVGGITMSQGIEMLTDDADTEVVLLVSKPPDRETMDALLEEVADCSKPVVVEFVGSDSDPVKEAGGIAADSLADAAVRAVRELGQETVSFDEGLDVFTASDQGENIVAERSTPDTDRQYLRGLYSGGTLTTEAVSMLEDELGDIASNTGAGSELAADETPERHTIIDLGADEFTRGRPHPMIDSTLRDVRLRQTIESDDALVVLLDIVLGYSAQEDPAGAVVEVLEETNHDEWPFIVASVCGTTGDPQSWESQIRKLVDAGVCVAESNVDAARLAGNVLAATGVDQS